MLDSEGEAAELLDRAPPPLAPSRARRLAVGAGLALAAVGAVVVRRALAPCSALVDADEEPLSLTTLAEQYPQELVNLGPEAARDSAMVRYFRNVDAPASGLDGPAADEAVERRAAAAIQEALDYTDPEEAERFVKRQMHRAVLRSQSKRREIKRLIDEDKKATFLPPTNQSRALKPNLRDPKDQAQLAGCIFDATGLANSVARLGANINDLAHTCRDVKWDDFMNGHDAHTKVCSINLAAVISSVVGLATSIATAVDTCQFTLIPNVNALCSATITGLMTAVTGMAGGATMMAASCTTTGWYAKIPEGVTPSNVGSNARHDAKKAGLIPDERRLSESPHFSDDLAGRREATNASDHAPARRLLFGGGKGSLATQCATSIIGMEWSIAYLALNINSAKGNCPAKGFGLLKQVSENLCNVDVSSVITGFLTIIVYIEWIMWQCTDEVNLPAICGSGATAMLASMAGISKAASGMYLACDVAQRPLISHLLRFVNIVEKVPTPNFGRRLVEEARDRVVSGLFEREIAQLKQDYQSPEEVFRSVGYDFNSVGAAWRQEPKISASDIIVMAPDEPPATATSGLAALIAGGGRCAA